MSRTFLPARLLPVLALLWGSFPGPSLAAWTVEPIWGGEVRSIAFAPDDPAVVVAGTNGGQVYLSRNAGASWAPAGRVFSLPGWVVASLHFDTNDPGTLWAGLRGVWGGGAVVRSDDLGATWHPVAEREDGVFVLRTVPGEEGRLVLGTDSGVWISSDAGATWRHASAGEAGLVEVSSLLVDPRRPERIVAGTFRRAYRSDDGGHTWRGVFEGMALDSQVFTLQAAPAESETVWASTCGWVYRSLDGGASWQRFQEGLAERRTPSFEILTNGRLLAGTVAGVYASLDGGRSWRLKTRNDLSVLSIAHHPERPEVVLVGTEGAGVWRSRDGGETFEPATEGLASARVTALAGGADGLLAAVSHGGPASGIYRAEAGRFVHAMSDLPTILALTQSGDRAWAGTEQGLWERGSRYWSPVEALRGARVEQILPLPAGGVIARTDGGLWSRADEGWRPLTVGTERPLSAARGAGSLWWTSLDGLYRSDGGVAREVATPTAGGQVAWAGTRLLLASTRGVWSRDGLDQPWVARGEARGRLLETGDPDWPLVLVDGDRAELLSADGRHLELTLPVMARDLMAAAISSGRLYLGTAGQGLLSRPLAELTGALVAEREPPASGAAVGSSGSSP